MLLKITEHCSMGCSHCLSDCTENNKFMDEIILDQSIEFIKSHSSGLVSVVVSGGEPTEHPEFVKYLDKLVTELKNYPHISIIVTSNGLWMTKHIHEFESIRDKFSYNNCGKFVLWQVTNDPKYYPIDLYKVNINNLMKLKSMKNVCFERKIGWIYPQGRAEYNDLDYTTRAPKCFNIRSAALHMESFTDLLIFLSTRNFNCIPCIEYDGTLKLGESYLCKPCSNVWSSDMEIMESIRSFKCCKCSKAIEKLPEAAKSILK